MANIIEPAEFSPEEIEIIESLEALQEDEGQQVEQVGGAFQVEEAYELRTVQQRHIRKFNTVGTDYELQIAPILPRGDVLEVLSQVIASLLGRITQNMEPTDLVRFIMQSEDLTYPISLPFMPLHALTSERVFKEVEKVLQSFEEIRINSPIQINIIHVVLPNGGAVLRRKRAMKINEALSRKKCFITITNKDELCCARAIIVAKAKLDNASNWNNIRLGRVVQGDLAAQLHEKASVPIGPCGIPEIKKFQAVLPGYQIVLLSKDHFNAIIYKGPEASKKIYLYYYDNHYGIITTMTGFLCRNYYCTTCNKGYDHDEDHNCKVTCSCCHRKGCQQVAEETRITWKSCSDCGRFFKGEQCYENHKERKMRKGTPLRSICDNFKKCKQCKKVINCKGREMVSHTCGEIKCGACKEFVNPETHKCFIQPHKQNEKEKEFAEKHKEEIEEVAQKYLFFDFECIQETGVHVPNLVIIHDNEGNEVMFKGPNTRNEFCDWLFTEENAGAICIAHNLKAYDGYFILQYLYDQAILPELILNGTKLMSIYVATLDIKFIDSLNFIPMALARFPKTFGLTELKKGWFPHYFNIEANQAYVGKIPDKKFYDPDGMHENSRKEFLKWHSEMEESDFVFDFQKEIITYCRSDVDILRRCCLQFSEMFKEVTTLEPFSNCITIASACNLVFRHIFLQEDTIAIIPPQGYHPNDKYSIIALKWLELIKKETGTNIKHARNGGEQRLSGSCSTSFKVDGWDAEQRIAYDFHGCFFHGCLDCYERKTINPLNGLTMQELYENTLAKKQKMEAAGYTYIEMWECKFKKKLKENEEAREFVEEIKYVTPLEPRDAFYGGRTNACKLFFEGKAMYVDFTSLYPDRNKNEEYPLGHPIIITQNFADVSSYKGLLKLKILPPRDLYHPVLPFKCNGKLMFSLCRTCTLNLQQEPCTHSDEERAFVGTWVSLEIDKAIEKGYKVLEIYEVWHFSDFSSDLFKDYINTFLKIKQEASGWPSHCTTEEAKQKYIQDYCVHEGIRLDYNSITHNPGLRGLAKLMLNSFWGKFGEKPNKPKVVVTQSPEEYFKYLTSDAHEVTNVQLINEEVIELYYKQGDAFIEPGLRTNVVIAAFTTASARLKLYDILDKLGDRVLYYDTDSVIFTYKEGDWMPPLGDYLGELTSELPEGEYIIQFVSGGPKNYSYKTLNPTTNVEKTYCKVRGFTLNHRNSQLINFNTLCDVVTSSDEKTINIHTPWKIVRDSKTKNVKTRTENKLYRKVYNKRVVIEDFDTVPYGF